MAPTVLERRPITNRVLTELATVGFPVGDNGNPEDPFGWQGAPNAADSHFIPWMVLSPGVASPQSPPGALGDTGADWRVTYNLFLAGVSRQQTEAVGDRVRGDLVEIVRERVEGKTGAWRIQQLRCTAIGSNQRIASGFPDYYTQSDTYELMLTRSK